MIKIIDVKGKLDTLNSWNHDKFDAIVVTAFIDDNDVYNDYFFGREEDKDMAIEGCVDGSFYGYLPEWCFNDINAGRVSDVWDYIEKNFD